MIEENVFEILKESKELTSLPQVLAEVIRVADQEDSSPKDLAQVILKDPALTARLLRVVNSPLYGRTREISTINQAVVALGMRAVKAIALSTGLYRMFEKSATVVDRTRFWRHSMETAIACREIARACAYKPAEEAFILGLMHDLGILIMEANFPQQFKRLWQKVEDGRDLLKLEATCWGTNHARVGQFLMERWKLPSFMADTIASHHADFSSEPDTNKNTKLARILCLSNLVSKFRITNIPQIDEETLTKIDHLSDSLGITPIALVELQSKILGLLPKESDFLEIKIGSVTDLLEAANNLIYKQYFLVEKVMRDNRKMQEQLAQEEMKKAALETLKTITATLSHYINNSSATILGRAQLVQLVISEGKVKDENNILDNCMNIVIKQVQTITLILRELKKMSSFDTTKYSDSTSILDIEDRLKAQIDSLEKSLR